ncbi:hypothetical protein IGI04_024331 [Brassica rapa subsp. trilocularis]|uniref:NYN domain-containing protein n=1 Tax=Brassica rapa subsp. trilocularis TaxID=1813537 RepID=A0ABQ7M6E4_BRACM|nr:hypothetical protein IGI04_024331 [Brassica rapa subsp. trilocularis]
MEKKKKPEADVTAERETVNQESQRTEMGRKRHGEADVSSEREAPKQKTQRTEMGRKRHSEAHVTAEIEAVNQESQRTEMGRKRHSEAHVTAEIEAVNQESPRTEMGRKRHSEAHVTAEREAPKQKTQRTEIGQGSGGSGDGDGGYSSRCPDNSGVVVPQRHELQEADLLKRKMMLIWDYENAEIPTELDHSLARQLIIKKLLDAGFSGPVEFHVSVGYLNSIQPKMDDIVVYYANQCNRPTDRVTLGNQASDIAMTVWTEDWLDDHTEPQNVTFISGDGGFSKTLDLLTEAGHLVVLVTNAREKDPRAYLQWTMRECLSLPPDRVYKNPSEAKQAADKKVRSKAHLKTVRKSRVEARKEELEKAKTDPVPKSIVQLPDGSVQISIALENHTQKTVIRSIDDDCVSVVGVDDMGANKEIMEYLGRRIGKKSKLMQFKKVGDSNKWTLLVEDMTDRQAFLKLVQART